MSNKFSMDLSKFKKIASDKHTTTLKHNDGHELRIAHSAVSPKMRSELAALKIDKPTLMADGGQIKPVKTEDERAAEYSLQAQRTQDELQKRKDLEGAKKKPKPVQPIVDNSTVPHPDTMDQLHDLFKANGGRIEQYPRNEEHPTQGQEDISHIVDSPELALGRDPITRVSDKNVDKVLKHLAEPKNMADGGEADQSIPLDLNPQPPQVLQDRPLDEDVPPVPPMPPADLGAPAAPQVAPPSISSPEANRSPAATPAMNPAAANSAPPIGDLYSSGMATEKAANIAQAAALGKVANQQAEAYKQANLAQTKDDVTTGLALEHITDQVKAITDDVKQGHIQPNHYLENMSTGKRIQTAIGLILGGIGGGLTHSENPALQFLNSQIDRDLRAQEVELGKKHNLLSALNQQYGNSVVASNMFRMSRAEMLKNQINQAAAQSGTPLAAAQALKANSEIDLKYAPMAAATAAILGKSASGSNGGNIESRIAALRILKPEAAKDLESRYVPGVGEASVPVPEKAREELQSRESLQQQVAKLRQWSAQHGGELKILSPADVNYGRTLAKTVQDQYRRANGQGVFREAEAKFVNDIVADDPTEFFNKYRTDPKYKALEDSNLMSLNSLKAAHGLPQQSPESRLPPQQQAFVDWAKKNPNDPRSKIVLKKLGL